MLGYGLGGAIRAIIDNWALVRRAVNDGYVLVTNNRADFTSLMEREPDHPGLVCINVSHVPEPTQN